MRSSDAYSLFNLMIEKLRILHRHASVILGVVFFLTTGFQSYGEPPKIGARLSRSAIVMGDKISLDVKVVSDRGVKGRFPIFDGVQPGGFATVCGDTVELDAQYTASPIDVGSGRVQTDYSIPVQVFDSGFYSLPPIAYISGRDTVFTDPLTLKVVPVEAQATDEISDYTSVLPPSKGSFWDKFPLWLLEWWWIAIVVLLAAAGVFFFFSNFKRVKLRRAAKPLPPYEEACRDMELLRSQNLWENGQEKEYYTRLVDILRRYISRRFEIHAMEMTTGQILDSVKSHDRIHPYLKQFEAVLGVADFAKFANMRCTPEENTGAFEEVKNFIDSTRPTAEEIKTEAEKQKREDSEEKKVRWERRQKSVRKSRKSVRRKEVKK